MSEFDRKVMEKFYLVAHKMADKIYKYSVTAVYRRRKFINIYRDRRQKFINQLARISNIAFCHIIFTFLRDRHKIHGQSPKRKPRKITK